jgi:hypothetical protein
LRGGCFDYTTYIIKLCPYHDIFVMIDVYAVAVQRLSFSQHYVGVRDGGRVREDRLRRMLCRKTISDVSRSSERRCARVE